MAYAPRVSTLTGPLSVLHQTIVIATYRQLLNERERADVVVVPDILDTGDLVLSDSEWLIAAGEAAAEKLLPTLRAALATP